MAEFTTANDRKEASENSMVAYKAASDIAMNELPPTHPIRYKIRQQNNLFELTTRTHKYRMLFCNEKLVLNADF